MSNERITTHLRKAEVLAVALQLAEELGYTNITRDKLALRANISTGLVSRYFGTMAQLRRSIMRAAVAQKNLSVIAQGLTLKDPTALKVTDEIKQQTIQQILI